MLKISCAPGENISCKVPYELDSLRGNHEAVLNLSFIQPSATIWAEANHEIAWEQFILSPRFVTNTSKTIAEPLRVSELENVLNVQGDNFELSFSTTTGALNSYRSSGKERLLEPVRTNFWRAVTDNDCGNKLPQRCAVWKQASHKQHLISFTFRTEGSLCFVSASYLLATSPDSTLRVQYMIRADGTLEITQELSPGSSVLPEIPEFGMMFVLDGSLDTLSWYGRGPHEIIGIDKPEPHLDVTLVRSVINSHLISNLKSAATRLMSDSLRLQRATMEQDSILKVQRLSKLMPCLGSLRNWKPMTTSINCQSRTKAY